MENHTLGAPGVDVAPFSLNSGAIFGFIFPTSSEMVKPMKSLHKV